MPLVSPWKRMKIFLIIYKIIEKLLYENLIFLASPFSYCGCGGAR